MHSLVRSWAPSARAGALVLALGGCSGTHVRHEVDAATASDGGAIEIDAGRDPVALVDAGTSDVDAYVEVDAGGSEPPCEPRILVTARAARVAYFAPRADGYLAVAWSARDAEGARSLALQRLYSTGIARGEPRPIPGEHLTPIQDGLVAYGGSPPMFHHVDANGLAAGEPISAPEDWALVSDVVASGTSVRGTAVHRLEDGTYDTLVYALDVAGRAPEVRDVGDADRELAILGHEGDRELVFRRAGGAAIVERTTLDREVVHEHAWSHEAITPVAARFDASHGVWLVLAEERVTSDVGSYARPAIVALGTRDEERITRVVDARIMRAVVGTIAIGDGIGALAIDDHHGSSSVVFVSLDTLEVLEIREVPEMWRGAIAWLPGESSFAMVTETSPYEPSTTLTFHCGLRPAR
ncbi:hypothetical protein [Sandaracinus amylolyticus]|uniref:Lipoprotein n=1 Tax=Sandaracinus amylolyticus TaxID=927083 RepID=A0A0F6W6U7_9BACT|nr:hypothetical protein [Sandaracinus amylolyticus]AKF08993.1 hypothetical protein DB32_006142 [Sandaracinus amylolyticus]